ncbi:MAG: pyridoxal-phosphate dependent enzyme [Alphaproteobacteria bacterium]|nr:pyridoxal-phosphate dependent enzyme [Alphaproteobacteria bacterium]
MTLNDVKEARARIREFVNLSPCTESPRLSSQLDCKLFLKMENLQRTGAYKDRGAMNAVLSLDDAHKKAGVIAASAGPGWIIWLRPPSPATKAGRPFRPREPGNGCCF